MHPFNSQTEIFFRFLCLKNIQNKTSLITLRFTRAIFGSTSSQVLLASVIRKHSKTCKISMSQSAVSFLKNLYVDDSINGGDNETEVLIFHKNARKIMLEVGFKLVIDKPIIKSFVITLILITPCYALG